MRICFVSLNAYDTLTEPQIPEHCGGAERQQVLLGRALASQGHEVSFVTWDCGQTNGQIHEGITIHKTCRRDAGLPVLRFFTPRWSSLRRALASADAEIYYQQCADSLTGQVARWAESHGRKFVFAAASDSDCQSDLPTLTTRRERILYRQGLRLATWRISQTRYQQRMFREHFGCDSTVIPSIGPTNHGLIERAPDPQRGVLWVGRIVHVKRFEWLLEVAARCPEFTFQVVGGINRESDYAAQLVRKAGDHPNIVFHGRLPRTELDRLYQQAGALLCTSRWEGFPNTFLEAWSVGLPVVSTVDPDDIIETHQLGFVGRDPDTLAGHLRKLFGSTPVFGECAASCYAYFRQRHTPKRVTAAFEELLNLNHRPVPVDS